MAKKTDPGPRIDEALLEMAQDFRGSVLGEATAAPRIWDAHVERIRIGSLNNTACPGAQTNNLLALTKVSAHVAQRRYAHKFYLTGVITLSSCR
jgi:hypothetical protein